MKNPLIEQLKKTTPEQLEQVFHNVFDSDNGKLVLEYLKCNCFFYGTTKSNNPEDTAYNEGQRAAILVIERILNPVDSDSSNPLTDS